MKTVMKTMSASTRSPWPGLYVGLALTLIASETLLGTGLWLALRPGSRITDAALAAIAGSALTSLAGGVLLIAASLRGRRAPAPTARDPAAVRRPRNGEEAAALAHAQKMEALGLLAGGVAHDFNNRLHVIRNSLEVLRQSPEADNRRSLEMIRRSADQAAALTQQLLAFSRRQPVEPRPMDPNELIAQVAELLRHALGERITVETVLGAGVAAVAADAGQLETALLNLAINARDAMAHAGRLTIETANVTLEESLRSYRSYVMIAVSDTGSGMPAEVAARACEPFFTTKAPGRGTGLGLSQVAGFARSSGGEVRIASAPGQGTTVRIYLPRTAGHPEPAPRPEPEPPAGRKRPARPIRQAGKDMALAVGAGREG
jgi:signal transduction histidine kinase